MAPLACDFGHSTQWVKVGDQKADIDEGMVGLIRGLWKAGIRTQACCQGEGDAAAFIVFRTCEDATRFARRVARVPCDNLGLNFLNWGVCGVRWRVALLTCGRSEPEFCIHLYFPAEMITELAKRFV